MSAVRRVAPPGSTSPQPYHVPPRLPAQSLGPCTPQYHSRSVSPGDTDKPSSDDWIHASQALQTLLLQYHCKWTTCSGSISLLSPKSVRTTWPSLSSRMFSSLMSRYTMPSWRAMVTMLVLQMLSTCMSAQYIQHDMEGHPCITLCTMRGTPHLVEVLQGKSDFSDVDSGLLL